MMQFPFTLPLAICSLCIVSNKVKAAFIAVLAMLLYQSVALAHPVNDSIVQTEEATSGVLSDRLKNERRSAFNPYVVSTHKQKSLHNDGSIGYDSSSIFARWPSLSNSTRLAGSGRCIR